MSIISEEIDILPESYKKLKIVYRKDIEDTFCEVNDE